MTRRCGVNGGKAETAAPKPVSFPDAASRCLLQCPTEAKLARLNEGLEYLTSTAWRKKGICCAIPFSGGIML
jgi:hypothetical protein